MERSQTRAEVHALVWSRPFREVAVEVQISEPALRAICFRANVPVPPRGHWNKLRAGRPSPQIPLPPPGLGATNHVFVGTRRHLYSRNERAAAMQAPIAPSFSETADEVLTKVRSLVGRVARSPSRTHPLIAAALEAQRAWALGPDREREISGMRVERRRLRILNAVFLGLENAGFAAALSDADPHAARATIGHQRVVFRVIEVPPRLGRGAAGAGSLGKLRLELVGGHGNQDVREAWHDDDAVLEGRLSEIVVAIIAAGEAQYRELEQSHYEFQIEYLAHLEEEARRRVTEAARLAEEQQRRVSDARVSELAAQAAEFRRAADIRTYVSAAQATFVGGGTQTSLEISEWSVWALREADRIDPVLSGRFLTTMLVGGIRGATG